MSSKIFESVKMTKPGRSTFDLTHDVKMSMKFGFLYPVMVEDVAPGDKFMISCESLIRFAPMIAPVMHRVDATVHYFFVPKRLLWDNFMKWYKGEKDPLTNLPYEHPYIDIRYDSVNWTTLMDYMGIPDPVLNPGANENLQVSALPFAAYQMIWNEYYRDQNLQGEIEYKVQDGLVSGADETILTQIRNRAWMHDYFTSALPFAQKGDPVTIPVDGVVELDPSAVGQTQIIRDNLFLNPVVFPADVAAAGTSGTLIDSNTNDFILFDPNGTLVAQNATATLNDLRIAMRVQEWLEKSARGGTRDNEFIRAQFGVMTSDARLQRPEYITGIKTPVVISEVLNTTGTEEAPQGQMAGHGVTYIQGNYGSYYAEEPGYIIGLMNVQPQTAYFQGIAKHWLKIEDPTQNLFPVFGNLGEQSIELQELYAYTGQRKQTFGYVPRYSEYKYANNRVAGDFKQSLLFWHMARKFDSQPALNSDFIAADPTDRIFAVQDGTDYLWCQIINKVRASRLLPYYGTPTF